MIKKISLSILLCVLSAQLLQAQAQWTKVGNISDIPLNGVSDLIEDKDGNLYVCGYLQKPNRNYFVAKYNGSNWAELGPDDNLAANDAVTTLCTDPLGNIYATGQFTNGNGKKYIAWFNGTAWKELGDSNTLNANGNITSMVSDKVGNIYAAGDFKNANNKYFIAKYDGKRWSEISFDTNLTIMNPVRSISIDASDNLYAAMEVLEGSSLITYAMRYKNNQWEKITGNTSFSFSYGIGKIYPDKQGNLYAMTGWPDEGVVKFDGSKWSSLGKPSNSGVNSSLYGLAIDTNGQIYVAGFIKNGSGKSYVATYKNGAWSEYGGSGSLNNLTESSSFITAVILNKGMITAAISNPHLIVQYKPTATGLQDNNTTPASVQVFPNPASNFLEITTENSIFNSYSICDLMGNIILTGTINKNTTRINTDGLEPGIYIVNCNGNQQHNSRIIIR